jgi:hypothetical protein
MNTGGIGPLVCEQFGWRRQQWPAASRATLSLKSFLPVLVRQAPIPVRHDCPLRLSIPHPVTDHLFRAGTLVALQYSSNLTRTHHFNTLVQAT